MAQVPLIERSLTDLLQLAKEQKLNHGELYEFIVNKLTDTKHRALAFYIQSKSLERDDPEYKTDPEKNARWKRFYIYFHCIKSLQGQKLKLNSSSTIEELIFIIVQHKYD